MVPGGTRAEQEPDFMLVDNQKLARDRYCPKCIRKGEGEGGEQETLIEHFLSSLRKWSLPKGNMASSYMTWGLQKL
jgi:hypothetical protein